MNENSIETVVEDTQIDSGIMSILHGAYPALLSEDEIIRETGEPEFAIADALRRLASAGLVHRTDRFVFATRAAYHAGRLEYS